MDGGGYHYEDAHGAEDDVDDALHDNTEDLEEAPFIDLHHNRVLQLPGCAQHGPVQLVHLPGAPGNAQLTFMDELARESRNVDPLEVKVKDKQSLLQKFRERIMVQEHVFIHCIPQCLNQQTAGAGTVLPNQGQITPDKAVEKDEQGDEIVRLRPADYKDHFPAPNAQLQSDPNQLASPQVQPGAGPSPQGNREPAGTRNPIQLPVTSRNPLAIPGVDPLFFETLSPHSLQNLADSHQIHNEIVSQANRLGRAPGPDGSTNLAARLGNAVNFLRTQPPHVREGIVRGLERQLAGGAYP